MTELRIYLLGSPQVKLGGKALAPDRNKFIALLAYLAVSADIHSRETLAASLWPENDQSRAYANLQRTLWELNISALYGR